MKRVLFLSHVYPPAIDGGSQIIFKLCQELKSKGKQIWVITSDGWSTDDFVTPEAERIKAAPAIASRRRCGQVIRVKTIRRPAKVIRRIIGPVFWRFPWLKIIWWKPDVVIGGVFPTTIPIYAWAASRLTRSKLGLVPCFHRDDPAFHRWPLITILKKADIIYALTNNEKEYYVKQFKIKSSKLRVFRPQVDKGLIMLKNQKASFPKTHTILYLGSHSAHKRIEMLIEAFKKIQSSDLPAVSSANQAGRQMFKNCNLIIAGKETFYTPKIKAFISRLPKKVQKQIDLQGEYDRKKEIQLLDQATVLVNPSEHESLGLVFLEAWARKKPVIGADLDPLKELISNGETGFLFKQNSIPDLSAKIRQIIDNPDLAREMGKRGFELVNSDVEFGFGV